MTIKLCDRILIRICRENFPFELRPIQHGRQLIFATGGILNIYNTGKHTWQGVQGLTESRVEVVIEGAQRDDKKRLAVPPMSRKPKASGKRKPKASGMPKQKVVKWPGKRSDPPW